MNRDIIRPYRADFTWWITEELTSFSCRRFTSVFFIQAPSMLKYKFSYCFSVLNRSSSCYFIIIIIIIILLLLLLLLLLSLLLFISMSCLPCISTDLKQRPYNFCVFIYNCPQRVVSTVHRWNYMFFTTNLTHNLQSGGDNRTVYTQSPLVQEHFDGKRQINK